MFKKINWYNFDFLSFLQLSYSTGASSTGAISIRVAGVGWLSWTTAESLRAFVVRVFAYFRDENIAFYTAGKQAICGCQKTYTNTGTFPQTPIFSWLALCYVSLYEISPKVDSAEAVWKLYESSLKVLWKLSGSSSKAHESSRKQALLKFSGAG